MPCPTSVRMTTSIPSPNLLPFVGGTSCQAAGARIVKSDQLLSTGGGESHKAKLRHFKSVFERRFSVRFDLFETKLLLEQVCILPGIVRWQTAFRNRDSIHQAHSIRVVRRIDVVKEGNNFRFRAKTLR